MGNSAAKKILLPSLALIGILGLLGVFCIKYNFVKVEMGIVLLATSFGVVSILQMYRVSLQLNTIDRERTRTENELLRLSKEWEEKPKEITSDVSINSEQVLEAAVRAGKMGYYEVDFSKHLITMNQNQADILGYAGKDLTISKELFRSFIHVEDLPIWTQSFADLKKTGNNFSFICKILQPSGELKFVQHIVTIVKTEKDALPKYIGVNLDITQQRLLEDKFIDCLQTLEIVTMFAEIGIWKWDIRANNFVWDEMMSSLYGLKSIKRKISYEDWQKKLHPHDAERAEKEIMLALVGNKEYKTEFRVVWPDKSVHFMQANGVINRDTEGRPLQMIITHRDITNSKNTANTLVEMTKQLEAKNKEAEQFVFIASHDLQEPLRTLDSMVEYIQANASDNLQDDFKESLNFITQSTQRMRSLINDWLALSKIGKNATLSEVDLTSLTNTVINDLSASISQSGAVINIGTLPKLNVYEIEFRSLLQNLISNAIKYRKPNVQPEISINTEYQDGYWKFSISDNGIGIDEAYKDKVFGVFQRLHRKNEYEGTGIGLALCNKIVHLHKGEIWLQSQPNNGSVFYFTIKSNLI